MVSSNGDLDRLKIGLDKVTAIGSLVWSTEVFKYGKPGGSLAVIALGQEYVTEMVSSCRAAGELNNWDW